MPIKNITLNNPPRGELRPGHPWIYRSQIKVIGAGCQGGDLVSVQSAQGKFLAQGYFNPNSEISVRLLSRQPSPITGEFFKQRVQKALEFRQRVVSETNAYRVVSSEADDLPGLVVDRYAEVVVVQFLTLGMEKLRPMILDAMEALMHPVAIFERSDSASRRLEGLTDQVGWIGSKRQETVTIFEKDLRFNLTFGTGHKTGFYLDQRENRLWLRENTPPGSVLDAFCYEGAFGLHLARQGCHVTALDIQESAIARAKEHASANGLPPDQMEFCTANVFDQLKIFEKEKRRFDLVILDPPSFVKKRSALEGALAGMKEIILRSMKLLNENGRLAVFSCSYHVDDNLLMQTAMSAALDTRKSLRVLKFFKQSSDHPINPSIPETYYLKGFLFEVSS